MKEALDLFKIPFELKDYEGKSVSVGVGRFGPYVKWGELFISLPKGEDPLSVDNERVRQIIEEKDISLCHGIAGEILFLSLVGDNEIIDTKIELMLRIIRNNSNEKFYYRKKYSLISNSEDFSVFKGHPENLNILEGTGGFFYFFLNFCIATLKLKNYYF